MEQQKDFICLPSLYDTWPRLKGDLHAIATKEAKGLEALEEVLERNGYPGGVSLLRNVLKKEDHFTTDHFCAVQLPWLAQKALQIEDLFKCSEFKLQVRTCTASMSLTCCCCCLLESESCTGRRGCTHTAADLLPFGAVFLQFLQGTTNRWLPGVLSRWFSHLCHVCQPRKQTSVLIELL